MNQEMNQTTLSYLTQSEKESLFKEIYNDTGIHRKRNIAIFEVTLYCALRASELALLKLSSYDPQTHNICCHRLKGSRTNTLTIVDKKVIQALEDYLAERRTKDYETDALFVSQKGQPLSRQRLDALIKHYCAQAGNIPSSKWHMHVLKHTRAIELAEVESDVDDIQFWLGHKNVANTFIYLDYTPALRKNLFAKLKAREEEKNQIEP